MHKELFKAIMLRWNACAPGCPLYLTIAPQNAIMPYAVFTVVSDVPAETFNTLYETMRIQFSIFSKAKSVEQVMDLSESVKTCLENHKISVVGYPIMCSFTRLFSALLRDPEDAWHLVIDFSLWLNRGAGRY